MQLLLQTADFRSCLAALARKALVHRIDWDIDEPGTGVSHDFNVISIAVSKSGRGYSERIRLDFPVEKYG